MRRAGLEIERASSRHENADLVVEFDLRGPKRSHDELLVSVVRHPVVRAVSTGE